jgi:hypothetical protein
MKPTHIIFAALLGATSAAAEAPEVIKAVATPAAMGWNFDVSVAHGDTGWDHYADAWQIEDAQGNILGTRTLHHPHVDEQPFTRSLRQVMIPDGTREVFIRVKCSQAHWEEELFSVSLSR